MPTIVNQLVEKPTNSPCLQELLLSSSLGLQANHLVLEFCSLPVALKYLHNLLRGPNPAE